MSKHFHCILKIGYNHFNLTEDMLGGNQFAPQRKNVPSIIRGFKSAVTTTCRRNGDLLFNWQSKYHEHIVRNERAYKRIEIYIRNNPKKWYYDRLNVHLNS